jgi:hypothetical protein
VFDPPRLRKNLLELSLRDAGDAAIVREQDGARTGRALIQGENIRHEDAPLDGLLCLEPPV